MTTTIPSTIEPNLNNDLESNVKKKAKKLTLLPLIFLIYFEVSGGPFGEEPAVKGAGPFYALLGFIIFPFIWSIPEALVTAELATAYPGNGGYVIWAERAFGPFWGSVMGSWKYLSGVINNASYPSLCNSYLVKVLPIFNHGWYKNVSIAGFSIVLSILNYFGLNIVGYLAMAITVFSLSPFLILFGFAVPKFKPQRWLSRGQPGVKKKWTLFFNTLFWNLNFWDNASTLAGEVENPQKTFPTALFAAGLLTCIGYLIPLIATTGALPLDQEQWDPGYLADAADLITGNWLKIWVQIAAFFSTIGLFEAQLSSSSYQLLGMADLGFMPKFFTKRSRFNTPWVGILVSTIITLAMSYLPFEDVISSANFLYLVAMLLEFAAFVWLRKIKPSLKRPYRVPMRIPGLILMLTLPTGFMIFIAAISKHAVLEIGGSLIVFGILMYFFVNFCKSKKCFEFSTEGSLPEDVGQDGVQLENRT